MKKGILGRLAERNEARAETIPAELQRINDEITPFVFEDEKFYVAIRDNILVFDSNMLLIHTISIEDIIYSEIPLLQRVSEIVSAIDEPCIKLFVKRNGKFEKLSFQNRFDAIFIFRKLRRVASRPEENIEELYVEDNGAMIEHCIINQNQRRHLRGRLRKRAESEQVQKLAGVEDALETIINEQVTNPDSEINPEQIDECIELLEKLK